ncbi:MAG: homoserine dehydrogenase [Fluviicola sp. XM-24bin1]|nr:MAG: homoserine dehydrogenase [Fluviicola sp. XM-24bin1]
MSKKLTIGLIGFGCVGSGLYEVLNQSKLIDARIKSIVVKDPNKKRSIPQENFSFSRDVVLKDPEINLVVELIDDSEAAYEIVKSAIAAGKDVVTANKKLIAEHLSELLELTKKYGVSLLYEGAVAGSIPILRNLEEYYNNDSLSSIQGIVNGTTNYILTKSNEGIDYATALKDAQELGFAEANPTLDVQGYDSKFKLAILLKHTFGLEIDPKELLNIGIQNIRPQDVKFALEKGYRIKLLSRAEKIGNDVVGFVAPQFIDSTHFAYEVNNEFNAVIVEGLFSDKQLFIGKGAGSHPTASAVLSDISALKFDYKYEYRKSEDGDARFSQDFYLKVYAGSRYPEILDEIPFFSVDEVYQSKDYAYQTGWIHFEEFQQLDPNRRENLSLIVLPDNILSRKELEAVVTAAEESLEYA